MLDSSLSSAQGQDFEKGSATHCPKKSFFPTWLQMKSVNMQERKRLNICLSFVFYWQPIYFCFPS